MLGRCSAQKNAPLPTRPCRRFVGWPCRCSATDRGFPSHAQPRTHTHTYSRIACWTCWRRHLRGTLCGRSPTLEVSSPRRHQIRPDRRFRRYAEPHNLTCRTFYFLPSCITFSQRLEREFGKAETVAVRLLPAPAAVYQAKGGSRRRPVVLNRPPRPSQRATPFACSTTCSLRRSVSSSTRRTLWTTPWSPLLPSATLAPPRPGTASLTLCPHSAPFSIFASAALTPASPHRATLSIYCCHQPLKRTRLAASPSRQGVLAQLC